MTEHDAAPRMRAALAAYTGHSGWDAVITALREERVLERLEAAGAFVAAFRTFDEARYYDYKGASYYAARVALDRALGAWEALVRAEEGG